MGAPNAESVRINCKISRTEYRIRGLRPDGRPRFPYSFTTGAYVVVDDSDNPVAIHSDMKILMHQQVVARPLANDLKVVHESVLKRDSLEVGPPA